MPLLPQEIMQLAKVIDAELNIPTLTMHAAGVGVTLGNIAPGAQLFESAVKLLNEVNNQVPPRDRQLLQLFQAGANPPLSALARDLLVPPYFPPADPHDAILLGDTPFVARDGLRQSLRKFTTPLGNSTHVLVVRGAEPCGKSYSWQFLRHLSWTTVGAQAMPLRLKNTRYTPRQFVEQALMLLGLDPKALPPAADDPQLALVDPYINAFKGQLVNLARPYWLVIDDINDPSVTPELRAAAYAMAFAVEDVRPQRLWLVLLGYNEEITDPELNAIAQDDAEFPPPQLVAQHLETIAKAKANPLPAGRALEIAKLLFARFAKLDKAAMNTLTRLVQEMGEKLRAGLQP